MKTPFRNPHNFVHARFEPQVIAIIGGKGSMGRRLAEEFFKDGHEVRLTGEEPLPELGPVRPQEWGRAVRRWNGNVCKDADVVVFAVPIPLLSGHAGLTKIFGRTPPCGWREKLVIDICSTKAGAVRALAELPGATVIGTHPMFGPKVKTLTGQTVFLCPVPPADGNPVLQARLEVRSQWLKAFWARRGVQAVEISPDDHDAFMPAVQFGVLLSVLLYGEGLRQTGAPLEQVQHRGTPNSRVLCGRLARMVSPAMLSTYVNLAFDNPKNRDWLDQVISALDQLKAWMATGNRDAMLGWMKDLAGFQKPGFRSGFTEDSLFVDECLARRDFIAACLAREKDIQTALATPSEDGPANATAIACA